MIAKWKSNISSSATLAYNFKDESQIIQINNLQGDCYEDFNIQMLARQQLFTGHARNLTAHIILSPSPADAEKLTRLEWKEISNLFLKKAGMADLQSVVFLHLKEPFHSHIVLNRVDEKGLIFRGKHELAISHRIGDEISIELGLVRASRVRLVNPTLEESPILRQYSGLDSKLQSDLAEAAAPSKDESIDSNSMESFRALRPKNLEVRSFSHLSKEGISEEGISGHIIQHGNGRFIPTSLIGNPLETPQLAKSGIDDTDLTLKNTKLLLEEIRLEFERHLEKMRESHAVFNQKKYFSDLRERGYNVVEFRKRKTGVLFGYGVEKNGLQFSSSEIGSQYSLASLRKINRQGRVDVNKPFIDPAKIKQRTVYSEESKNEQDAGSVSHELNRTICRLILKKDIEKIVSEGPFESCFDFVEAIRRRGHIVELRKKEDEIVGYTTHIGPEYFHDHELGQGQFALAQLLLNGILQKIQNVRPQQKKTIEEIHESLVGVPDHLQEPIEQSIHKIDQFKINENSKQNRIEINETKRLIAEELLEIIDSIIEKDKLFTIEKYIELAKKKGFVFAGIADTSLRSDYTINKYGHSFRPGELHRDLTSDRLLKKEVDTNRNQNQYAKRIIGYKPTRDIDKGQGFGYGR
jgi:hypothetical protein